MYKGLFVDSLIDQHFLNEQYDISNVQQKCYRVMALCPTMTDRKVTFSNTICLPYKPIMWVPNAFSPNSDNLNESFRPISFGLERYSIDVYDKWGGLITTFTNLDDSWKARDVSSGVYVIMINAVGFDKKAIRFRQTLTIMK